MVKVNCGSDTQNAANYGITSVPAILYFKKGELSDQVVGMISKDEYAEKLNKLL